MKSVQSGRFQRIQVDGPSTLTDDLRFMAQTDFYYRIKSQIEEADIIEMNIPIFRGKGSGPNAGEKVHRYDVTYQLLLRTSLMKNMAKLKGMSEEFRE